MLEYLIIIKLNLKIRFKGQFITLIKKFKFLNKIKMRNVCILFFLYQVIIALLIGNILRIFAYKYFNLFICNLVLILLYLSFHIINGCICYKRTHIPINIKLLIVSPRSKRYIFSFLIMEELVWLFFDNIHFYIITLFLIISFNINSQNILWSIILLIIVSLCLYLLSNRIFGLYIIHLILNPIGIIRFLVYMIKSVIIFLIGYNLTSNLCKVVSIIKNQIIMSPENIKSNKLWEDIISILKSEWLYNIKQNLLDFLNNKIQISTIINNQFNTVTFYGIILFLLSVLIILLMFLIFYPNYDKSKSIKSLNVTFKDSLYYYIKFVNYINKLMFKDNFFLKKDITILINSRWIISPLFFNLVFVTTESWLYYGLIFALIKNINDSGYVISLILILNILTLTNHCFELRLQYPMLFTLSSEGHNMILINISGNSSNIAYKSKLYLLRIILIIPTIILFIFDIILISKDFSLLTCFLVILTLVVSYFISPIFQLYIAPLISKFNTDNIQDINENKKEDELYMHFQKLPRKFIISPILITLYLNIFFNCPIYVINILPLLFSVYFCVGCLIFYFISIKITKNGLNKIDKEMW